MDVGFVGVLIGFSLRICYVWCVCLVDGLRGGLLFWVGWFWVCVGWCGLCLVC